jgi:hypothetical protein
MTGRSLLTLGLALELLVASTASGTAGQPRPGGRLGGADTSPAVGAEVPDFELVTLESFLAGKEEKVRLSSFRGKRDVVLVLTSYT